MTWYLAPKRTSKTWMLDPPTKQKSVKQRVALVFAENGPLGWKGDPVPRRLTDGNQFFVEGSAPKRTSKTWFLDPKKPKRTKRKSGK
jgi:hypothetical protein